MSNAIVKFSDVRDIAKSMAKSGYFSDTQTLEKAIVKIIAGQEIGLGAFSSMTGIHIILGKPALGANVIATLIKNDDRYDYKVILLTDKVCEIAFYEKDKEGQLKEAGRSLFSIEDAVTAKLSHKEIWKKYPRNMLFSRAVSNGARWYAAGIFGGMPVYTPEELGEDVDQDGNIIDAELRDPEQTGSLLFTSGKDDGKAPDVVKETEILDAEIKPKTTTAPEVIPPDDDVQWSPDDADREAIRLMLIEGKSNADIKKELDLPLLKILKYRKELDV